MSNHVHRYEKTVLGKNNYTVFRCNLPTCNHYIAYKLAEGKKTLCNRCGNEMILDARAMKFVKPYCTDCVQIRRKPIHDKLLEFFEASEGKSTDTV